MKIKHFSVEITEGKSQTQIIQFLKSMGLAMLVSTLPIVIVYGHNVEEITLAQTIRPIFYSALLALISFFITLTFVKRHRIACLFSIILFLFYAHYNSIFDFMQHYGLINHWHMMPLTIVLLAHILYFLIQLEKNSLKNCILILAGISLPIFFYNCVIIGVSTLRFKNDTKSRLASNTTIKNASPPDIYYFVLDEFASPRTLKSEWGFDNKAFINTLIQEGFFIPNASESRYSQTDWNVPSLHQLDYITPPVSQDSFLYYIYERSRIKNSKVAQTLNKTRFSDRVNAWNNSNITAILKEHGYNINIYEGVSQHYKSININPADLHMSYADMARDFGSSNVSDDFTTIIWEKSIASTLEAYFINNEERKHMNYFGAKYILNFLKNIKRSETSMFNYFHLMTPHSPFLFTRDGKYRKAEMESRKDGEHYINSSKNNGPYLDQQIFLQNELIQVVAHLKKVYENKPLIILLQGDHGPRPHHFLLKDHRSAFDIFIALYTSHSDYSRLYNTISPINVSRHVLNTAVGEKLEFISDK